MKRGILMSCLAIIMACASCVKKDSLKVIDKEIRYVKDGITTVPRPAPIPVQSRLDIPALPSTNFEVPYPWKTENLSSSTNPNFAYKEPDKPWIVQLAISSRYTFDTREGAQDYKAWYRVSNDDGKTWPELKPVIKQGQGFDLMKPVPGVVIGKNSFCPAGTSPILRASNGEIMVPFYSWPLDEKGELYDPYKANTYTVAGVLIGKWTTDGKDMLWDSSQTVDLDVKAATRGADEPTIIELKKKGSFVMVIRGSNERCPDKAKMPGRRWVAFSKDYCRTWTKPEPMTYTDGELFYSPSSSSIIIRSVLNQKVYWIGNISRTNTDGNSPRYPLIIGEVDEAKGALIKGTIISIDDINPRYDSEKIQLSNFQAYQDPRTGNILVVLCRLDFDWWLETSKKPVNWYLISVPVK
ncbi:MAG: sialidase family protein [Kiritimatiellaeota bacterium]|nr:sialidase family protein [Kiritimatiellota bacterium]